MTDHNQKTESPKFKMLKMQHDIDNLAFMLKEHCESHPESVTVKGLPELSNRDLSIAVNNLVSRVNKIDNLDKIEPKPVEDSPLTLDQCEVGMELECLASLSYIPNEDRIYKGDILTIGNIQKTLLYCTEKPLRAIAKDELSYFRIHKPAPAVVHYVESEDVATCGEDVATDWSLVTCADCLKHKPKSLPTDNWGDVNTPEQNKTPKVPTPDEEMAEKLNYAHEIADEYDKVIVDKSEWDKLQSDRKEVADKLRKLSEMLGGGKWQRSG
jgi:hypothetical protein